MGCSSTGSEKAAGGGQRVRIQNKYAVAEYDSLDECADSLSRVGVLKRDEIREMLEDRVGYINGFVIKYL